MSPALTVRAEAEIGRKQDKLVPLLWRLKPDELPEDYRKLHCISIDQWDADSEAEIFKQVLDAIRSTAHRNEVAVQRRKIEVQTRRASGELQPQRLTPGAWFRDDHCPEMIVVPAAPRGFFMGSKWPDEDARKASPEARDIRPAECPERLVSIGYNFAVSKFPISFEQWDWGASQPDGPKRRPRDKGVRGRLPVTDVSWQDAVEYVQFLSRLTKMNYRLLSEAEWEYACRANQPGVFGHREPMSLRITRFDAGGIRGLRISKKVLKPDQDRPIEVTSCAANEFGLCGMNGNVWEWVQDHWHEDYNGNPPNDGSAWEDRAGGWKHKPRVIRGGSYASQLRDIRATHRQFRNPRARQPKIGFRIARDLA